MIVDANVTLYAITCSTDADFARFFDLRWVDPLH